MMILDELISGDLLDEKHMIASVGDVE